MTEAEQSPSASPALESPAPQAAGGAGWLGKVLLAGAAVMAIAAAGVAIYRGQKQEAAVVAPATADASQAPSVDDVIAKLEAKLKADPENAEGWRMLGWSYFQTERYAEAATALKKATRLDPDHAETFSFLGEALVLASDSEGRIPPDAQAAFDRALQLDPKDARARYFKAVAMDLSGQHRRAIDMWFDLLADTPSDAPYADDIRDVIRNVGQKYKIDVDKRLAEARFAAPAAGMVTDGAQKAASGIPGPTGDEMKAAAGLPKGQQEAMVRGMVDGLEAKLAQNPGNPDGWIMLMRSRMQLGEPGKAGKALQDGLAAFRNDQAASRRLREAASTLAVPGA
ncbi:tetratricopeptide repeat protein [Novosphingobium sp.]|uniref:tetratricopeptide repeat protein n=1 Tax=Novosphingobium sp. TaxID=1874826 RepID=UPI00352A9E3B